MSSNSSNNQDTFYIYTTGIVDWCNLENTFKYWEDKLCSHVCSLIPQRFTKIEIVHSDILCDFNGIVSITNEKKNQVIQDINMRLQLEYMRDSRIVSSIFFSTSLNIFERPHIIIDFAHVHNILDPNLNIIYLGYVGEEQII